MGTLQVLVEPEVAETTPASPDVAQQLEQQLENSSPVPSGGDPWEDSKWSQYKVGWCSRSVQNKLWVHTLC